MNREKSTRRPATLSPRAYFNWSQWKQVLSVPVNGSSLALLRIALGVVMALEAYSLCRPYPEAISMGTSPLETYFTGADIKFHLPYHGFEWLPLLPPVGIHVLVGVLGVAGLTMAAGLFYRVSAALVSLCWTYLWVVESTRSYWQSHYYIETLLLFLMIWMPAARRLSVDAWLARQRPPPRTVPFWCIFLLRGQLVITYFYAGVAKLNLDWLADAVPVRWFLTEPHVTARYAPYLTPAQFQAFEGFLHSLGFAYFISYVGLVFDLAVGFLFLFRRTRYFALLLMLMFHVTNHLLIFDNIGWFPFVGMGTATIFLETDWPERVWRWLRSPRFGRPDWAWFIAGAVAFPVVGAALGWRAKAAPVPAEGRERMALGRWTLPLVFGWLVWQSLMPIRHYFIPGDGRFTNEGLSFSWRLKSERHHAISVQIQVRDPAIIATNAAGGRQVQWNEWRGERVLYRVVNPGRINWADVPEIAIVAEPVLGERVIYNPFNPRAARTEGEARERIRRFWSRTYGRVPDAVKPTVPLPLMLEAIANGLKSGGQLKEAEVLARQALAARRFEGQPRSSPAVNRFRQDLLLLLKELRLRDERGVLLAYLRSLPPYSLEGEPSSPVPFLWIDDAKLLRAAPKILPVIDRQRWQPVPPDLDRPAGNTNEVLVVLLSDVGAEGRDSLPQACVFEPLDRAGTGPYIWWNCFRDLTASKYTHISNQPFYLRRYARRIAELWQKEYGRRPAVTAITSVSLNGRPHQLLVHPDVDLASVPLVWFGHNPWIRDLETPRIPHAALESPENP